VQPIINLLRDHLLESPLTYGDETTVQVLKEPGKSAQSKSFMWAQMTQGSGPDGTGPPIRLFGYLAIWLCGYVAIWPRVARQRRRPCMPACGRGRF
jgi:hypothetical protein